MADMPDCAASWKVADEPCYKRPAFVFTTGDGMLTLACEGHAGTLLTLALKGHGEAAVKAYEGN